MSNKNTKNVRVRDWQQAIFRPQSPENVKQANVDTDVGKELEREVMCFTVLGKHDYLNNSEDPMMHDESNKDVLAKIVTVNEGNPRYLIKRDSNGRLFNPLGMDEGRHNKFLHHAGKDQYEFRGVNRKAFDFYLQFLKTKNLAHLRTAEREVF